MKTLSLVIPCYNEAARLEKSAFLEAIEKWPWLALCFVDDGSTDSTAEKIAHLERLSPSIKALYLGKNKGKAEAVRTGVKYLCENECADCVGFWDADLATPLSEIPRFMEYFDSNPATEAVIASRWPRLGANIKRSSIRNLTGAFAKSLIRLMLKSPVWDTQCGAKIFSKSLAAKVFERPFRTKWLFDVELLMRMGKHKLSTSTIEHPIRAWSDIPGSKLGFNALTDFLRLFKLSLFDETPDSAAITIRTP